MATSDTYNVVSTGQILDGFSPIDVREGLISAFRLKPAQAESFFEKPRVLKKGLPLASAEKICSQLAKLGVAAEVQNHAPAVASPPAEPTLGLQEDAAPAPATLELVQDEPGNSAQAGMIECPACGHTQAKGEQCESCGVWFHKFDPAAAAAAAEPANTPGAIPGAIPGADAVVQPTGTVDAVIPPTPVSENGGLGLVAIVAATVAALLGAWVWKFVAVNFDYEFGVIAWAIGGAVGFAAASMGSRGAVAGVVCGVLALGSIGLGKYWAYSAFVDQFQDAITDVMAIDDEMYDYYEEEVDDARAFVNGSGSDTFVRRFMFERGYTDAMDASSISAAELDDFRTYVEPALREMAVSEPDFEEWKASSMEAMDEISPWLMMRENFGFLDIIFIFLGIGTAFRLGSQMG